MSDQDTLANPTDAAHRALVNHLRLELARERLDRRESEVRERQLWLAMGHLRAGRPDRADELLGGLVPLVPAR